MEFGDLGSHCDMAGCHQQDFLPFKCEKCSKVFCHNHRSYDSHSCEAHFDLNVMPQCPVCGKFLKKKADELPDLVVEQHIADGCQGAELDDGKNSKNSKCSFKKCKKTEAVPIICKSCFKNFCLNHRHVDDHKCEGVAPSNPRPSSSSVPKSSTASTGRASRPSANESSRPSGREVLEAAKKKVGASSTISTAASSARRRPNRNDAFLNRAQLKFKAVGDSFIGIGDRLYFDVSIGSGISSRKSGIAVWLNKRDSTLRAAEKVASLAGIRSSQTFESKSIYKLAKGDADLSMDSTLEELVEQGVIQDGDSLILSV